MKNLKRMHVEYERRTKSSNFYCLQRRLGVDDKEWLFKNYKGSTIAVPKNVTLLQLTDKEGIPLRVTRLIKDIPKEGVGEHRVGLDVNDDSSHDVPNICSLGCSEKHRVRPTTNLEVYLDFPEIVMGPVVAAVDGHGDRRVGAKYNLRSRDDGCTSGCQKWWSPPTILTVGGGGLVATVVTGYGGGGLATGRDSDGSGGGGCRWSW
nr:DEAD-box ATP-dependent RNA helicase 28 [Tanacetum cinerariifolium]